jgi:ADP-heptose:LPS heptosyltransferase
VIQQLCDRLPHTEFVLLYAAANSRAALTLPGIGQISLHHAIATQHCLSQTADLRDLIQVLQAEAFDAALLFTEDTISPHPIAYLCYLAGIPIRIGRSLEFGGGVLSHAVKPEAGYGAIAA